MSKKFLKKNEIRVDLNPKHYNKYGLPHDAIISGKVGHLCLANTKTHSKYVDGVLSLDLEPNLPENVKHKRVSPPFWQNEKQFGPRKGKASKKLVREIRRYNRQFK